jgi:hypothetical protein
MNEVAKVFGGSVNVVNSAEIAKRIAESAQNDPRGAAIGDSDYLNFSGKRGLYTIGADNRQIKKDELWAVNIASFEDGWVAWRGGKPVGIRMANIFTGVPIAQPDAQDGGPFDYENGEGWNQAKSMVLRSLDHDQQGYFRINSKSGVSSFATLQKEVAERSQAGLACWPVLTLDIGEFTAQGHKNYFPKMDVYGWLDDTNVQHLVDPDMDIDDLIEASEGGNEIALVASAAKRQPDPEPEPTTPSRRRRL